MADVKISQLPSATTPLAGTEVLPIVQGGVTSKVSAANITAGREVSMSSATVSAGNLTFGSTAQRITGDFSNATVANRVMFQTSTANGNTALSLIPNGTGVVSSLDIYNAADPANASLTIISPNATESRFIATRTGTGSFLPMTFYIGGSERVRIDTSGRLLVGQTSDSINARLSVTSTSNGFHAVTTDTGSVAGSFERNNAGILVNFRNNGSDVSGAYIYNNTTSVSYATGSDYRLKEDVQPMTGALGKVVALKPVTYKWKVNGSAGQGFIAHELAEVCPDAVTGEKDAVDAKGNPKYQGVDTSFLVATLTAAIQELKAEFDAYKATHP